MKNNNKQKFLLAYFEDSPQSDFREINGFILFKHWSGGSNEWQVDIFTKDSWKKLNYQNRYTVIEELKQKDIEQLEIDNNLN